MCAIFGVGFLNGSTFRNNVAFGRLLRNLFMESDIRGGSASGIAFVSHHKINVLKKNVRAELFTASKAYNKAVRIYGDLEVEGPEGIISVIGHSRLKTKGCPTYDANNHPIHAEDIIGVHNGQIANDEILFGECLRDEPRFARAGEVDSEIIFRLLDLYINKKGMNTKTGILKTVERIRGGYACSFVNARNPYLVWFFRNTNPTTILVYREVGVVIWASVRNHIIDAVKKTNVDFGVPEEIPYEPMEGVGINMHTNAITQFDLTVVNREHIDKDAMHTMSY